jgi:hypothetical protein
MTLGLVLAAAIGLDGLGSSRGVARSTAASRTGRMLATTLATLAVVAAAVVAAPAATAVLAGTAAVRAGEPRTLPALVAAEAVTDPGLATLVVTPLETAVAARLDHGAGRTLAEQRSITATSVLGGSGLPGTAGSEVDDAEAQQLATIVGNLVAPSGRDLTPELDALDVRFVLLEAGAEGSGSESAATAASAVAALDGNAQLAPVGDTDAGRLYRVVADDESRAAAPPRPGSTGLILGVQLGILTLTLLLAVPTSLRPRRPRVDSGVDEGPAATFEAGDDDD